MKYALLLYEDETGLERSKTGPQFDDLMQRHLAFQKEIGAKRIGGSGLKGTVTATTVRTSGGASTIHDGPFAETKEQLGGFYLIDAADLDEAIAIAKKVPLLRGGSVEIRPLLFE